MLLAIGLTHEVAHGSLRLSLVTTTPPRTWTIFLEVLPGIIQRLRSMSPPVGANPEG